MVGYTFNAIMVKSHFRNRRDMTQNEGILHDAPPDKCVHSIAPAI